MAADMWLQLFGGSSYYGSKPNVPEFPSIQKIQGDTLAANIQNMPAMQQYGSQANAFNVQQLQSMLESLSPGYGQMATQIGQNINSQLRGEIPLGVQQAVQNSAAARAVGGGYGGSTMARNLVARDFGMTSYGITQNATDSASRWLSMSAGLAGGMMTGTNQMGVTPAMGIDVSQSQWQQRWLAQQIAAAPDPVKRGRADQEMAIFSAIMSAVGGIAGAAACWVAREVYGKDNPKWLFFRHWLFEFAPKWFRNLYVRHGERFAEWLKDKPCLKRFIRKWMDKKVDIAYGAFTNCIA